VNAINQVDMATMKQMRREVEFWYPMDLRVSGRDLIPNHLTMSLYNHAAIWKDNADMWPRGFYCCGLVQVDGEKMSKSKGNFITVEDANTLWGADATRFTCADAGDGILNANYDRKVVNQAILALTTEFEWITDTLNRNQGKAAASKAVSALRPPGAPAVWLDGWFANEMTVIAAAAAKAYDAMRFKEALKTSFYLMQEARDRYRAGTSHVGASEELVRQWAEWQALMMNPITPHWSEAIWEFLGKEGLCVHAKWPVPAVPEDPAITRAGEYLFEVAHTLSASLVKSTQPKKAGKGGAAPEAAEKPNQVTR
jgi:leucyl-tRNA synthetase